MQQYLNLLQDILDNGEDSDDRTGTGTLSVFGRQMRFDMRDGFPLLTTKKLHTKSIIHELLWFIAGNTNIAYLNENGVTIWDEWADSNGNLGPIYGKQWRRWKHLYNNIDQVQNAINQIKNNPTSRRIIVNAWNVGELEDMALPPCHMMYQFNVSGDYLDLQWYQRSVDTFLGLPYNITSYAILLHMIAKVTNKVPRSLIWTGGNVHLYKNHLEQTKLQLSRKPLELPSIKLVNRVNIDDFEYEDICITNYVAHPHISAPISV